MEYKRGDRVIHREKGPATVYQDRAADTYIHITPDSERGLIISVRETDLLQSA